MRRTLAAALVATLLSAAGAVTGMAAPPASAATETAAASLVVAPDDGGVVRTGKALGVTVEVTNSGTEALPAGRVDLSLERVPVASTSALMTALQNPPGVLLGYAAEGATAKTPALEAGASASVRVTIKADVLSDILRSASGTRLLYARYRAEASQVAVQTVQESSVVKVASGSSASVGLGVVVPVVAPANATGVVDIATQQQLVAPGGAWSEALRAAQADPSATVALDPAVLASIRIAGDAAPPEVGDFLDQLGHLSNEFVRLPYADTDLTLARAAGSSSSLEPTSFAGVTLASTATDGPTPAPTATAGATAAAAAELTDWTWSDRKVAWPVPHTATGADLSGFGSDGDQVLLASDDVKDTPARKAAGPLAHIGDTRVLVSDETVSSLLSSAGTGGTAGASALATLTGVLATAAVTGETTALLATVGRSTDVQHLDQVLDRLAGRRWVRMTSLGDLGDATGPTVGLQTRSVSAARVATARSLLAGEHEVQLLGRAIIAGRDTVTAPQHLALLGALSAEWSSDSGWSSAVSTVRSGFTTVLGKVGLTEGSEGNAIGTDGTLSVRVQNTLSEPVSVVVHASASNGRLQFTQESTSVAVPAGGQNVAKLSYRSITNGSTTVSLVLSTRSGAVLDRGTRQFTVSAGFDTIVAIVLLSALALLLALGVYRNITRRRSRRPAAA